MPSGTPASFYGTADDAEIHLMLKFPKQGLWAIEIKRGATARPERGFHIACEDLQPSRRFLVNAGKDRYPFAPDLKAIGVGSLAPELAAL